MSGQNTPDGDRCRGRGEHGVTVALTVGPGVSSSQRQSCYNSHFAEGFDTQPGSTRCRIRAGGPWAAMASALVVMVLDTPMAAGPS